MILAMFLPVVDRQSEQDGKRDGNNFEDQIGEIDAHSLADPQ